MRIRIKCVVTETTCRFHVLPLRWPNLQSSCRVPSLTPGIWLVPQHAAKLPTHVLTVNFLRAVSLHMTGHHDVLRWNQAPSFDLPIL